MHRLFPPAFFILIFSSWSLFCFAQGGTFQLSGSLVNQRAGIVVLSYINSSKIWVKDTCRLRKGQFYFKGQISEPVIAHLRGAIQSQADDDPNAASFFLWPAKMRIQLLRDNFKQFRLKGSPAQEEYESLLASISLINATGDDYFKQMMDSTAQFISRHPASYVSAFELLLFMQQMQLDTVNALYHRLGPVIQQSEYGRAIYPRLKQLLGSLPGRMAADFDAMAINGQAIQLSSFRGRYVLLDFWASWCIPCRTGAPRLRAQYLRYHPAGLEIIGIADDDARPDVWKQAIEKDSSFLWYNVLRGLKTGPGDKEDKTASLNDLFGIGVLPSKILVGRDGVIIGRYEGEEQETLLAKKLAELFPGL